MTNGYGEAKECVSRKKCIPTTFLIHRRVGLSGENSEPKYSNYLCFVVSVQTNKLMSEYGGKYGGIAYTESQQRTHDLIKSLHESGLGYRRIAQHLNSKNITTLTGKECKGNHVFAVLKRYREREERFSKKRGSV